MAIRLVDDDLDLSLTLSVSWEVREALQIQLQRCLCPSGVASFDERIVDSLIDILDQDLKPPTASQVSYARSISRGLGIPLTQEVLLYKGSMHEFLARNAPVFKEQGNPKKPPARVRLPSRKR